MGIYTYIAKRFVRGSVIYMKTEFLLISKNYSVLSFFNFVSYIFLGAQLDSWLMVMVFMDLSPIVWCILCSVHDSIAQRFQRSTTENSYQDESELHTNSNESTQLNSLRIVPSTFMQTAELLSLTMKKWSPAYQLNEMIMKHVDGCIFSHASWRKFIIHIFWLNWYIRCDY